MDQDEQDRKKQLTKEIQVLKLKLAKQEDLIQGREEWEGQQYYKEAEDLEAKRVQRQRQYHTLMRDHFRFIKKNSWLQKNSDAFLEQKLDKGIKSLIRQIQNLLENRSSKSSISNTSLFDKVESIDWLLHDRSQKYVKEQEKIKVQIAQLQKILENIK